MDEKIFQAILHSILIKLRSGEDINRRLEEYEEWCRVSNTKFGIDTSKELKHINNIQREYNESGYTDKLKSMIIDSIFGGENNG